MTHIEILTYVIDNLSYLCVPLGLAYPAYRRIVGDRRTDRRENQKDTFVQQLSERVREMQTRGDLALEDKARLTAENNLLTNENHSLKKQLDGVESSLEQLQTQNSALQRTTQELKGQCDMLLASNSRRGGRS